MTNISVEQLNTRFDTLERRLFKIKQIMSIRCAKVDITSQEEIIIDSEFAQINKELNELYSIFIHHFIAKE